MDAIKTEYKEIIFDSKSEAVVGEEENAMRKTIHLMGMFVLIFLLFISLFPAVSFEFLSKCTQEKMPDDRGKT